MPRLFYFLTVQDVWVVVVSGISLRLKVFLKARFTLLTGFRKTRKELALHTIDFIVVRWSV